MMQTKRVDLLLVERVFHRSLELACMQHALSWELRTAKSFAELRLMQGRPAEATGLLAPVFDRFTEGFDSSDLRGAKSLLDRLAAS